jgi:hypothetical protein
MCKNLLKRIVITGDGFPTIEGAIMKKALTIFFVVLPLGLIGCANQVPTPSTYEPSYQAKILAAHHWNLLATSVAQRLQQALSGLNGTDKLVMHVKHPHSGTVFNSAFHELLETQLMQSGFGVTRSPADATLMVEYNVKYAGEADFDINTGFTEIEVPDDDIIITVSVTNDNRYIARISEIFYIDQATSKEYLAANPVPSRLIEVVGE